MERPFSIANLGNAGLYLFSHICNKINPYCRMELCPYFAFLCNLVILFAKNRVLSNWLEIDKDSILL